MVEIGAGTALPGLLAAKVGELFLPKQRVVIVVVVVAAVAAE